MLDVERRRHITEILAERRVATVSLLCELLKVSPATVRRDLAALEARGIVDRTWGGATLRAHLQVGPQWLYDSGPHQDLKVRIARVAADLVRPGQSVSMQSGGTLFEIARRLIRIPRLRFITNSMRTAQFVKSNGKSVEVTLVGGTLSDEGFLSGPIANLTIEQFTADITFVSTHAVSVERGLMDKDPITAEIKRVLMRNARQRILVADHHKLGKTSDIKVEDWNAVDTFITNREADPQFVGAVSDLGVKVMLA